MKQVKLSPPWIEFYDKVEVLFEKDPEVRTEFDDETYTIKVYVDNQDKAEALAKLLPTERVFGNILVKVVVIPANKEITDKRELLEAAFKGNEAFKGIVSTQDPFKTTDFTFVVCAKEVVQYFNDNLQELNGIHSTLYEDVAEDVFKHIDGVFYSTATE